MKSHNIAFIGAGNMASALIGGLVADGLAASRIIATDQDPAKLAALQAQAGIRTEHDNSAAVAQADVVVLAVKPQGLAEVATEIAGSVHERRPLVISIAAGIRSHDLQTWLGGEIPVVRCMPNTPAMLQAGATVLYATPQVSGSQRQLAESIMRAVGMTEWIDDEDLMDAVTALSGSGPAYFFLVMEAMQAAGEALGLTARTAHLLTLQTALGAARMALESNHDPVTLRARVTSPGGTTEAAIRQFEQDDLRGTFMRAMQAAHARSVELSHLLGEKT